MIATESLDNAENAVIHYGGIRFRVNGSGNLRITYQSLDNVKNKVLIPLVMATGTDKEPFRLGNFVTQRMFVRVETTDIDEIFKINRVIVFARPLYSQYPGI